MYASFNEKSKYGILYKMLILSFIGNLVLYSKWGMWWGGWTFGCRLMIESIPVLFIFLYFAYEKYIIKKGVFRLFFLILVLKSVYIHLLGAFVYPAGFNFESDNIDNNKERLWKWKDSQIDRCTKKLIGKIRRYIE